MSGNYPSWIMPSTGFISDFSVCVLLACLPAVCVCVDINPTTNRATREVMRVSLKLKNSAFILFLACLRETSLPNYTPIVKVRFVLNATNEQPPRRKHLYCNSLHNLKALSMFTRLEWSLRGLFSEFTKE